ncbi:Cell number regulator [Thalictrum thalictroides]|uniref:Cell number regulator n=1 Tax=Thalictrum thalictroides TaxID=46969 RepID=A0A7J6VPM7_THATH|nr:Cell number regulator [Thalictrum thalictroides]
MANSEESSPLLSTQQQQGDEKPNQAQAPTAPSFPPSPTKKSTTTVEKCGGGGEGWTVDGLPLGHGGSVVGEPVGRNQWNSSLFACLGRNDDFCSSDLEVCLLGSLAPCVLYGGNAERLGSGAGSFANHCLPYTGLYLLGNSLFGWNCMAPLFSHHTRSAIRRKFNLEVSLSAVDF